MSSKIRATGDHVILIQPDPSDVHGTLVLPGQSKTSFFYGRVVAVGGEVPKDGAPGEGEIAFFDAAASRAIALTTNQAKSTQVIALPYQGIMMTIPQSTFEREFPEKPVPTGSVLAKLKEALADK